MRISDWSSDVCSSDLCVQAQGARIDENNGQHALERGRKVQGLYRACRGRGAGRVERRLAVADRARGVMLWSPMRSEERRVGKSVSVRVDLGGRRIIKKKREVTLEYINLF